MNVLVVLEAHPDADEPRLEPLRWALERARRASDRITVLVVGATVGPAAGALEEEANHLLLAWEGVSRLERLPGEAAREVLRVLGRDAWNELVLSGGTRTPAGKIRPGGLAEHLLLNAPVTLTLVR